jgi:predicted nucleic acid-binding protein
VILVDTSVWVTHLRGTHPHLVDLLEADAVLGHSWVTGEIALGNLANRSETLTLLAGLPQAVLADDAEVMHLIEAKTLHGADIGYIDAQLLAATRLTPDARLWTTDKRLHALATRLGIAAPTRDHPPPPTHPGN